MRVISTTIKMTIAVITPFDKAACRLSGAFTLFISKNAISEKAIRRMKHGL